MLSRWTDFLTSDGEKPWRNRDAEFDESYPGKEAIIIASLPGWECLLGALESLKPWDLGKIIYIRNEGQTVLEAIQRQLAHDPHHVGQILYQAKVLKETILCRFRSQKGLQAILTGRNLPRKRE